MNNKVIDFISKLITEKEGKVNESDILLLFNGLSKDGLNLGLNHFRELVENELGFYNAKKYQIRIIQKPRIVMACREFLKKTSGNYSKSQWLNFLNELSRQGYFNKNEVSYIIFCNYIIYFITFCNCELKNSLKTNIQSIN